MSLVTLVDIHLAYGAQDVLTGVDLDLVAGARVGLVGSNGTGKTTLLRIVAGQQAPDHGEVIRGRGLSMKLLKQERQFGRTGSAGARVMDVALHARADLLEMERKLHALEHHVAAHPEDSAALHEVGTLRDQYEHRGGYRFRADVESVLLGLGMDRAKWDLPADSLSGGEAGRLELAAIMLSQPDLLLLDEPTNHLDMAGVEFLEYWLKEFKGAVLTVSHDRSFLDNVATSIAELRNGKIELYAGNYSFYALERELRAARRMKEFEAQQEFIAKTEAWISKNIASATSSRQAKSRRKMLERLERVDRPNADGTAPLLMFPGGMRSAEEIVAGVDLTHGYGERVLFQDVNLAVRRGEKIGVAGPNGAGKSTLARILAGRLAPRSGEVRPGRKVQLLYFDQAQADLPAQGTPFTLVRDAYPKATNEQLRTHLGRFHFSAAEADKDVRTLSGGERARLALALETLKPANFLVLDEPTNHLDLPSREALEEALDTFDGTVILVSHDRYLLDAVTTRTWLVEDGRVEDEVGCYSEARARVLARRAQVSTSGSQESVRETAAQAHKRWEKEHRARERELQRVEERITKVEAEMATLDVTLSNPATPWQALSEAQERRKALAQELDGLMVDWERLSTAVHASQPGGTA